MTKIGTFKILDSFNITGRGVIITGYFIDDGKARVGSTSIVEIQGTPAKVKIIGVEVGSAEFEEMRFGFLLSFESPDLENVAKRERIKEQTIEIFFE